MVTLALIGMGILIVSVSPPSTAMWSWETAGFLLVALGILVFAAAPGALVAQHHSWGTAFRRLLEERFAHPRLAGLAEVWAGLVLSGWVAATTLLRVPFSPELAAMLTLAMGAVAFAPMLALNLFDRRRS
jgi:hypothetical protein